MSDESRPTPQPRWRIRGILTTASPLHIGSGDVTCVAHPHLKDKAGQPNDIQAVVKDYAGRPCIPGSALKGVLRSWAEAMLLSAETGAQRFEARLNRIFGHRNIDDKQSESGWAEFCPAMARTPSELEPLEAYTPYWNAASLTGVCSHVSIDRYAGAASHNKLFYEEYVPEGIAFDVDITATRLGADDISLLLAVLEQGASHPTHPWRFGAGGGNGWGHMQWELIDVQHSSQGLEDLQAEQVGFAGCKPVSGVLPMKIDDALHVPAHAAFQLRLDCAGPFLVNDASRTRHERMTEAEKQMRNSFTPLHRADGQVWLPAASFRGALRERAEFLLRSLDPAATGDPNQAPGDGPIERIFGLTSQAARLVIEEFTEVGRCEKKRQDFVAIDRFTGGAAEGAKFDVLYADRPTFQSRLTLNLDGLQPQDMALLRLALRDICEGQAPLGWGGSKGYGVVAGTLSEARVFGAPEAWRVSGAIWSDVLAEGDQRWMAQHLAAFRSGEAPRSNATAAVDQVSVVQASGSQTETGVLIVAPSKRGRLVYTLHYTRADGRQRRVPINQESEVHPDLRQPTPGTEVDFDLEGNDRVRIRPQGVVWEGSEAPDKAPESRAGRFAHTYYFLRMADRKDFSQEPLGDSKPVGHARLQPGRFSGRIRVVLTAKTELLICDDACVDEDPETGHKTYRLRLKDGKPDLASSSVRGMLRSVYEAVTNSRFGVFPAKPGEDDFRKRANARPPGYRMRAEDGLGLVPVRIEDGKAFLMLGATPQLPRFDQGAQRWRLPGALYAAWAPQYRKDVSGYAPGAVKVDGRPPQHGQRAWCWLEKMKHNVRPMQFWRVRAAASDPQGLSAAPPKPSKDNRNYASLQQFIAREGVFVISNQNTKEKHDERFFFEETPTPAVMDEGVWRQYQLLIQDCQDIHDSELIERIQKKGTLPTLYTASTVSPGGVAAEKPAMSRHTYVSPTGVGATYCYGAAFEQGGQYHIRALYPVMISRQLFDKTPWDLLPESLRPATDMARLSPADRVFGWVSQDENAQGEADAAYRSHVRLGPVTCVSDPQDAIDPTPRRLAILGQPKPQQGRFYLGDQNGQVPSEKRSKEKAGYVETNRIRGPKVYLHHRHGVVAQYAHSSEEPSNQNRTVNGCVKPGARFEFDLHLTNLSGFELGALLWMLSLPEDHYLKLGLGKPLGFGSVRAEMDADQTVISDGEAWIEALTEWRARPESIDPAALITQFEHIMQASNPNLLTSFLRAAAGVEDVPVHYPMLSSRNEHFEWFVANDKVENQYALPDLSAPDITLRRDLR